MSTRTLLHRFGFVLLILLGTLTGCETRTEYTLGAILPLSGSGAAYGEDIKRGMDLELEAINAEGGVAGLPLRILYEDSASDEAKGAPAAERLIEQKVTAIIGGGLSSVTMAAAPVAEKHEIILLSPAASTPQLTGAGNYIFRIYPSDVVEGTMMAEFALNVVGLKRIMVMALNNEYGRGLKTIFNRRYRQMPNREIVKVENFPQGKTDWADVIAVIRKVKPDGIYLVSYPDEALSFLKLLREENLGLPVLASRAFNDAILQDPAAEGVIFPLDPFNPERTEPAKKFAAAYLAKFDEEANVWAANGADSVRLLADGIEAVGANPDALRSWVSQVRQWEGASGLVSFDTNGDVEKRPIISIVHDGRFMSYKDYKELKG